MQHPALSSGPPGPSGGRVMWQPREARARPCPPVVASFGCGTVATGSGGVPDRVDPRQAVVLNIPAAQCDRSRGGEVHAAIETPTPPTVSAP